MSNLRNDCMRTITLEIRKSVKNEGNFKYSSMKLIINE